MNASSGTASSSPATVLIASYLEVDQVARIEAAFRGRVRVVYEPDLLPIPRYDGDHHGVARDLDEADQRRWHELLAAADVLFDFDWADPAEMPRNCPRLRWVQATSAGIGEFLLRTGLAQSDFMFTTAAGVHAVPLAEFVVMGLLYLVKNVPWLRQQQARHAWERHTTDLLAGRRLLVIGLGNVGRQIARMCGSLGVEVSGVDPAFGEPPEGVARLVDSGDLSSALCHTDALVLACPYTKETHHLIGFPELAAIRSGALLVNVSRGAVIDELALIEALGRGRLGGAVLDVFDHEPLPADSPLWDMPHVLISPHSASTVSGENKHIVDLFVDNLGRYLQGLPLRNVFVTDTGY